MSAHLTIPFDEWLRCQAARDDIIGVFARSAPKDPLFPSAANYREYLDYFEGTGILSWVSEAYDAAWSEYVRLRFSSDVMIARCGDDLWSVMFPNTSDYIMMGEDNLAAAAAEIAPVISALSGQTIRKRYGFEPGETFVFPTMTEVSVEYRDVSVDITFDNHPSGIDLEIARALSDAITSQTSFCALFEEDEILAWSSRDEDAA